MPVTLSVVGSERKVTLDLPEPQANVLHEVVSWQLAKRRRGTASTKTRGTVSGTTAKMYPQKGTGAPATAATRPPSLSGAGSPSVRYLVIIAIPCPRRSASSVWPWRWRIVPIVAS